MLIFILAVIAIFLGTRLLQTQDESISPAAPESRPAAQVPEDQLEACVALTFSIGTDASPSAEASPSLSPSPSPSAESSPPASSSPSPSPSQGTQAASSPSPSPSSASLAQSESTSTPAPVKTSTPTPKLPDAGVGIPTIVATGAGLILLIGAVLLAI